VYVRTNVNRDNPEGSSWCSISLAQHHGIINISVGASNLVWAITWDGLGLVRTNVSRNNVYGSSWISVESPDNSTKLMQVAVGRNAVWALSRDCQVWFRKGTWGDNTFWSEENAVGSVWVKMFGEMSQIALSSNDQVFAIDTTGLLVYFRTGVTRQDLTGKTWQRVLLREDLSQFKELGLLSEGHVCSCGQEGTLCELHDLPQEHALSESTSCSSVSLSTTTSSPAIFNDYGLGHGDVFLSPLQPSQSAETFNVPALVDHLPPAWVIGADNEVEQPDTPTAAQNDSQFSYEYEPTAGGDGVSHSASLPPLTVFEVKESEAESVRSEQDSRVRSISEYNLTDSQHHSSTVSPASSTGTIKIVCSGSALGNSDELNSASNLMLQENLHVDNSHDPNFTSQFKHGKDCPQPDEKFVGQGTRLNSEFAADHVRKSTSDKLKMGIEKSVGEAKQMPQAVTEIMHNADCDADLTEVDRHFKKLADSTLKKDTLLNHTVIDDNQSSDVNNILTIDSCVEGDVLPKSSNLLPVVTTNNEYTNASLQSDVSNLGPIVEDYFSHSRPVNKVTNENCHREQNTNLQILTDNVFPQEADAEYNVRRPSKSRKRTRSLKKLDIGDQKESIVFKSVHKKEDNSKRKASSDFSVEKDVKENNEALPSKSEAHSRQNTKMTSTKKAQVCDMVNLTDELAQSTGSPGSLTDSSDSGNNSTSKAVEKQCLIEEEHSRCSDINKYSGHEISSGSEFLNNAADSCKNIVSAILGEQPVTTVSHLRGSEDRVDLNPDISSSSGTLREENSNSSVISTKKIKIPPEDAYQDNSNKDTMLQDKCLKELPLDVPENENQDKSMNLSDAKLQACIDLRDENFCDKNDIYKKLKDCSDTVNGIQVKMDDTDFTPSYNTENISCENCINNGNTEKATDQSLTNVSCGTENERIETVLRKPSTRNKRKLLTKDIMWCSLTKLTPSQKMSSTSTGVSLTADAESKEKGSGSESDEIADFVTDLLSEEEEEEQSIQVAESHNEADRDASENEDKCESAEPTESNKVSDSSVRLSTELSQSVQTLRASSISSTGSIASNEAHLSVLRRTSSSIHGSPSVPTSLNLRRSGLYHQTPSPASLSSPPTVGLDGSLDEFHAQTIVPAQARLCWRWLDATSCIVDDSSKVEWLSRWEDEHEPRATKVKISKHLREKLLQQILTRNRREVADFKSLEAAVEKSTWVHKANMQLFQYGRRSHWVPCSIELEQGIGSREEGTFTVYYTHRRKQRHTQVQLSDITCVKTCSDPDLPTAFSIYMPDLNLSQQPILLQASSEKEASEWLSLLSFARASAWNLNRPIMPGAIWSCTFIGDVLVSPNQPLLEKPSSRCWGQHGGHMAVVETSPCGVTWSLGFDRMPYVYNGGFGGAVGTGQSDMSDNTQQHMDFHRVYVYENQKWFPIVGWCNKGVFNHNFHWVTSSGHFVASKEEVKLPSSKWHWTSDWTVDFNTSGGVDSNGWQYSNQMNGSFHQKRHIRDHFRRRRYVRRCRINFMGPWTSVGSLSINDLSIQIDPVDSPSDPVVMWAVAANGDVLCRYGVTPSNPVGQSWAHVSSDVDKPFISISVGGRGQVWGLAADGSAWYRTGVTPDNPGGKCWLQVVPPPPGNFRLHQVSAGTLAVWAVDKGDNLWRRENITPTFPEGTGWELVANRVKRVSVGLLDQVWIVADALFQKSRHGPGVIYHRQGISDKCPAGTQWQHVIGSGWAHVSVRGMPLSPQSQQLASVLEK
ncbi:tectonin beta-propeller repeat-containing protein 1-like, partial [Plakobranchus ocellatus]